MILFYIFPIRKKLLYKNLSIAFPDKSSEYYKNLAKACYRFFIKHVLQFFALPKSFLTLQIDVVGKDLLDTILEQGRGVIFVSGHFGAWEILAAWLGFNKYPITAVAMKQSNAGSDRFFIEQRSLLGMKHIYRKASLDNMYKIIQDKGILALVSDQDAKKRGVFVNYFNQQTSTPKGAARFHLKTGAPIIFTVCYQHKPGSYTIEFIPIETSSDATIKSITQSYTSVLEKFVCKDAEQYFWFHRRWKTKHLIDR